MTSGAISSPPTDTSAYTRLFASSEIGWTESAKKPDGSAGCRVVGRHQLGPIRTGFVVGRDESAAPQACRRHHLFG
jgi:hypothetical protein